MVSVVKLNCQKHHALTMVNFMKLNPRDHRALESGLITLHGTRLGPKKVHTMGPDRGLKGHESGRCSWWSQAVYKATLKSSFSNFPTYVMV